MGEMYQQMYTQLFNAITDALAYMDAERYSTAANLLRAAQYETEELCMSWDDDNGDDM